MEVEGVADLDINAEIARIDREREAVHRAIAATHKEVAAAERRERWLLPLWLVSVAIIGAAFGYSVAAMMLSACHL